MLRQIWRARTNSSSSWPGLEEWKADGRRQTAGQIQLVLAASRPIRGSYGYHLADRGPIGLDT